MKFICIIITTILYTALVVSPIFPPAVSADSGLGVFDEKMQPILTNYLKVHDMLASDSIEGIHPFARNISKAAIRLEVKSAASEHKKHFKTVPNSLQKTAEALSRAVDIKQAREAFKQLSKPMAVWATVAKPAGVDVVFCSMAQASWLQKRGEVRNPYYGKSMLNCGEVVGTSPHSQAPNKHETNGPADRGNVHTTSHGADRSSNHSSGRSSGSMEHEKHEQHGGCSRH